MEVLRGAGRRLVKVLTDAETHVRIWAASALGSIGPAAKPDWRAHAVVVCDGGPDFSGVEYDLRAGRFHHIDFNGSG
ncbi:MAG TPA: hypothetical protein VF919_02020 [Gemmatimonadales bacterium]